MASSSGGNKPFSSPSKTATQQRNSTNQSKHSGPVYFSDSLFRNKRLKQKRLKWQLAISKATRPVRRKNRKKTDSQSRRSKANLSTLPPEVTIDLLSDDDENAKPNQQTNSTLPSGSSLQHPSSSSLPQIIVFPGHMQLSEVPNITLIPVQPLSKEAAASLQNRMRRKRKSQKPKRHAEPTIINNESIVLSDDSNQANTEGVEPEENPAACSTPNHVESIISPKSVCPPPLSYFNTNHIQNNHHNEAADFKVCSADSVSNALRSVQVDEEVTVSLVPRSAAGSCSSKGTNAAELFPLVPDETTVQTIISNRIYELSLSKLREGLATSGVGDFAEEANQQKPIPTTTTRRKGTTFNLPPKLKQPNLQPVSLKLSSDLSISLISDDEDDQQQQRLNAEKLLRQQPHLSVRPVGIVTMRQPPKRRKLG